MQSVFIKRHKIQRRRKQIKSGKGMMGARLMKYIEKRIKEGIWAMVMYNFPHL